MRKVTTVLIQIAARVFTIICFTILIPVYYVIIIIGGTEKLATTMLISGCTVLKVDSDKLVTDIKNGKYKKLKLG